MKLKFACAALALIAVAPANAAVVLTATPGTAVYSGPTPTFDFETPAPVTGGLVTTGSLSGVRAQPFGSTGNYLTVGPTDGSPATLNLASFGNIGVITFIWGSVDAYNTLEVLRRNGTVMQAFTGANAAVNPNGNQTSPVTNPLARLTFSGSDIFDVGGLRFRSTQNAFEVDNFAIRAAVPEPATWMMMLAGFGIVGAALRRRRQVGGLATA